MMEVLVASHPPRPLRGPGFALSAVTHLLTIGLALTVGRATAPAVLKPVMDTTMVFLPRLAPIAADRPLPRLVGGAGAGSGQERGLIISADPPARGFQTIGIVNVIPPDIPPIGAGERALDPRDFTGRGVEGGTGWGVTGGTGSADQLPPDGEVRDQLYDVLTRDQRFLAAELLREPVFEMPRVLTEAGIGGRVVLQFIIDTMGLVEPASVSVLSATHRAYGVAAEAGVGSARFRPARYGERAVRQLTKWPVSFEVAGR